MKFVVPPWRTRGTHLAQLALVAMICTIAVPSCGDGRQGLPNASETTPDAGNLPDGEPPQAAFVGLASGHAHTCYIDNDHALWCWGDNNHGQLGDGTRISSSVPKRVDATWRAVGAGSSHTCGVRSDGTLWCWGSNGNGTLGTGDDAEQRETPTQVGTDTNWNTVVSHSYHSCAIRTDHTLWCWGYNGNNQIGTSMVPDQRTPAQVGGENWQSVATGGQLTCGIQLDGSLWCWGRNLSHRGDFELSIPTREPTNSEWKRVVTGYSNMCGIRTDGSLYCWGGLGIYNLESYEPGRVEAANDWIELSTADADFSGVSLGSNHTCGIRADHSMWCFASQPTASDIKTKRLDARNDWQTVSAGANHSCAARTDGTVWCWGADVRGQLGQGHAVGGPVRVGPTNDWLSVNASASGSCGVRANGTLWCWGDGIELPVQVGSETTWQSLNGRIGLRSDGSAWNLSVEIPAKLGVTTEWNSIAVSGSHTCVVRPNGTLWCRGGNDQGQLGDGSTTTRADFVQVGSANDWSRVAAAGTYGSDPSGTTVNWGHTCGVRTSGDLWCWGGNINGEVGDGTLTDRSQPVQIQPAGVWQSVSMGIWYTCALRRDGSLWCWGRDEFGQLGNGVKGTDRFPYLSTSVPMREQTASTWRSVDGGDWSACGIKFDHTLWCWGDIANSLGLAANPNVPTQVGPATDWQTIATGNWHACGIRSGGSLWCLGDGSGGRLGDGNASRTDPVAVSFP